MGVDATFKFLAYTVPAIMVLGGILLLVLGYPINNGAMIKGGWASVFFGPFIYIIELALAYSSND